MASRFGATLLQIITVLGGTAGVYMGASKLGQLNLLQTQWGSANGRKYCTSNGMQVSNSTKTKNEVLLYGGLALILLSFILPHIGNFSFRGFGFSMGMGGMGMGGMGGGMYQQQYY